MNCTHHFHITVDGRPLAEEVLTLLLSASLDSSLHLPDTFALTFADPNRDVLERAGLAIGKTVSVSVHSDAAAAGEPLLEGAEVVALEAEFEPTGVRKVVRGFDKSHRLMRGRRVEAYKNVTYSEIARRVAQRAGLRAGDIRATSPVHPHVVLACESDWEFLWHLAREIGYEVSVTDGRLNFRPPADSSEAPEAGGMTSRDPLQLVLGDDLLWFRGAVTGAEQVGEVRVRSWDPKGKQALVGTAAARTKSGSISITPEELSRLFGNPSHESAELAFGTQAQCDAAASAIAEEIAGCFAAFDGVARGNTKLKAGVAISLGLVGPPFDGKYVVTEVRHAITSEEGFRTWFCVSGRAQRSLLGLATGGGRAGKGGASHPPINGVMPAIVTDVSDPEGRCRVKLRFPWLSSDYETDWARTAQPWAGNGFGSMILPEVNDEVLVAFEQGDIGRPYVLGSLYNGVDAPPSASPALVDSSTGKLNKRVLVTRTGHRLAFTEKPTESDGIELATGDQKYLLDLSKASRKLRLLGDGTLEIECTGAGTISIKAAGDLELSGRRIAIKARGGVEIDGGGGTVDVKAGSRVGVQGGVVAINGRGSAEVKSGGILTVQGSLVKIN